MSEFWKSNPKKFCDFCKCWFADNKSSIDFHERGKRHKENVEKKIAELRKKGLEQYEQKKEENSYFKKMEEAALKAFKKDAQKDSGLASQYNNAVVEQKMKQFEELRQAEADGFVTPKESQQGAWYEAKTPEDHTYYWNDVTGVSQWEKPTDFVPLADATDKSETEKEESKKTKKEMKKKKEKKAKKEKKDGEEEDEEEDKEEDEDSESASETTTAPERTSEKRKADVYGGWTTVVQEDRPEVDLQLPQNNVSYISQYRPQVEQRQPEEEFEFGEKKVTILAKPGTSSINIGFKKRKINKGSRTLRQRDDS